MPVGAVVLAIIPPFFPIDIGFIVLAPPTFVVFTGAFPLAIAIFVTLPVNLVFVLVIPGLLTEPSLGHVSCENRFILSGVAIDDTVVDR